MPEIPQGLCSKCHEGFMNCKCEQFHPTFIFPEIKSILPYSESEFKSIINRLIRRSEIEIDCYIWHGAKTNNGYGKMQFYGKSDLVHRWSAGLFLELDLFSDNRNIQANHNDELCTNKNCWNPKHLYIGDPRSNTLDVLKKGRYEKGNYQTHCKRGHEFTKENTYVDSHGSRHCRECNRNQHGYF